MKKLSTLNIMLVCVVLLCLISGTVYAAPGPNLPNPTNLSISSLAGASTPQFKWSQAIPSQAVLDAFEVYGWQYTSPSTAPALTIPSAAWSTEVLNNHSTFTQSYTLEPAGMGYTPGYNTKWMFGVTAKGHSLLEPDLTIYNTGGVMTSSAGYTPQAIPTGFTASAKTLNSMTVTALGAFNNLTWEQSGLIFNVNGTDQPKTTNTQQSFTGLSANTKYAFKAAGVNGNGNATDYSPVTNIYTLQNAPTGIRADGRSAGGVIFTALGDLPNLSAGQSGLIYNVNGVDLAKSTTFPTTVNKLASGTALTPNHQYKFKVRAVNGDGIATSSYSPVVTLYTGQNTPVHTRVDAKDVNSLTVSALGYLYYISNDQSGVVFNINDGDLPKVQTTKLKIDKLAGGTPLAANTLYLLKSKAVNGDGVETPYSDTNQIYTLQNAPSTPTLTALGADRIVVSVNALNNAFDRCGAVIFNINGTDDKSSVKSLSHTFARLPDKVTHLAFNTQYQIKAKALNGNAIETDYSAPLSIYSAQAKPTGIDVDASDTTSITLTARGEFNNLSTGQSGIVFQINGSSLPKQPAAEYKVTNLANGTPIATNTRYWFGAYAVNADGVKTGSITHASVSTAQNAPTGLRIDTRDSTSISLTALGIFPNLTTAQSGIVFNINDSDLPKQTTGKTKITALADTTPLTANTAYILKVKAQNCDGVGTAYTTPVETYTSALAPIFDSAGAGSVHCQSGDIQFVPDALGTTYIFEAVNGFGEGDTKAGQYGYVWDQSPTLPAFWTGAGSGVWTGGTLQFTPTQAGTYYLHIRAYNADFSAVSAGVTSAPYIVE